MYHEVVARAQALILGLAHPQQCLSIIRDVSTNRAVHGKILGRLGERLDRLMEEASE